ncbi:cation diffusion facilitator family transporter [Intrasporangium calvum]|nr:cation diffusion facilitator family transporter [Intrasporangium calvum]
MSALEGTGHGHHDDEHDHDHEHDHEHDHDHEHEHGTGPLAWFREVFRPHSHDSADSVDPALESSAQGIRAVKISLVALLATALAQAVVVVVTGSVALFADTVHNFSDALTAVPLWIAFVLARRPANRSYTYGYGRAEDLAGVFIVAMIALSAVLAGWESVRRLVDPQPLTYPWVVVVAGLIGFAGNELVALYRIRVGRQIGSAALVADGLHARTDGFTSLAVVLGAVGVMVGFPLADPVIGLLITVAILFVLKGAGRDIYRRLMDAVDPALVVLAERTLAATPGVVDVESVRLRWIGHRVHAEAEVSVDPALSVVAGHGIAIEAHHRLLHHIPRLARVSVHVSPAGADGDAQHRLLAHHVDVA